MKNIFLAEKLLFIAVLASFLGACASVPYTGRKHMLLVSNKEELELGKTEYEKVLKEAKLSTDTVKVEMVKRVGQKLAKVSDAPADFVWEFNLLVEDKTVNAFCLPGGKVAVYTGLLPVAKDEAGLAVVMGHEIAHALARHGAERMSQGMMAGIGGKILDTALSNKSGASRDIIGKAYGLGVNVGVMLPFSRSHESEADRIGLLIMAKAGYDPRASLEFWKRMDSSGGSKDSPLAKYLSTHPAHGARIQNLQGWMPEALQYYEARQK